MSIDAAARGGDDDVCPACGGDADVIVASPGSSVIAFCTECPWDAGSENGPSRPAGDTSIGAAAPASADTAAVLCEVCRITEADLHQPGNTHAARHTRSEPAGTPKCKWSLNNVRLYRHIHRGGSLDDLACLFCLIPDGDPEGRKWADIHRQHGEPICNPAYLASGRKKGSATRRRLPSGASADGFGYDASGRTFDYGTMTREEYMTARNR